jgi:hypothetical protein
MAEPLSKSFNNRRERASFPTKIFRGAAESQKVGYLLCWMMKKEA